MTIDLENLTEQDIKNMSSDELNEALAQVLKATDRETQIKVLRAIMRYQNIDGLNLEKVLESGLI